MTGRLRHWVVDRDCPTRAGAYHGPRDLPRRSLRLTDDTLHPVLPTMLHETRLRQRGPTPRLADSEVLAMEVAGEFLGLETDSGIYRHVRQHHRALVPALATVHRTTFLRQAANLWAVKRVLWQALVPQARGDDQLSILDSVPVPVSRVSRAERRRLLPGVAAYGRDPCLPGLFIGLRAHRRITWPGVIAGFELAPANTADIAVPPELLSHATGWALGDRAYWSPAVRELLGAEGVALLAPFQTRKYEKTPWTRRLVNTRRRIETVLAPLVERYRGKRMRARDRWHLCSRWLREVLSHTTAVLLCQQHGLGSLACSQLIQARSAAGVPRRPQALGRADGDGPGGGQPCFTSSPVKRPGVAGC